MGSAARVKATSHQAESNAPATQLTTCMPLVSSDTTYARNSNTLHGQMTLCQRGGLELGPARYGRPGGLIEKGSASPFAVCLALDP
jgi:hypothetical protein